MSLKWRRTGCEDLSDHVSVKQSNSLITGNSHFEYVWICSMFYECWGRMNCKHRQNWLPIICSLAHKNVMFIWCSITSASHLENHRMQICADIPTTGCHCFVKLIIVIHQTIFLCPTTKKIKFIFSSKEGSSQNNGQVLLCSLSPTETHNWAWGMEGRAGICRWTDNLIDSLENPFRKPWQSRL